MRSFITACLFAFAAAQDKLSCAQYEEDVAKAIVGSAYEQFGAIRVYGSSSWTDDQQSEFNEQIADITADGFSDEASAAWQVISTYSWVLAAVTDDTPIELVTFVDLEAQPGTPDTNLYEDACFDADEEDETPDGLTPEEIAALLLEQLAAALATGELAVQAMTWDKLENPHDVTTDALHLKGADIEDWEAQGLESADQVYGSMMAKTGWQPAVSSDESVVFNFMFSFDMGDFYTNTSLSSLTIAFADAEDSTDIEVNRFEFVSFLETEYARLIYDKMNMAADDDEETTDTTLSTMTGFAPFDDTKSFHLQWMGPNVDNFGPGEEPRATFALDKETPGFWSIVKSATTLSSTTAGFVCSLEKSADNLGMTKAIKEGGSIMMKVGYKDDDVTDFTAHSDLIEVAWAAEPVVVDPVDPIDGGNVDVGGESGNTDNTNVDDGATAVTAFGAAVIAAISALAF